MSVRFVQLVNRARTPPKLSVTGSVSARHFPGKMIMDRRVPPATWLRRAGGSLLFCLAIPLVKPEEEHENQEYSTNRRIRDTHRVKPTQPFSDQTNEYFASLHPPCNEGTDDETKHNEHHHQLAQVRRPSDSYMLRAMRARVLFPEHNTNRHVCNVYRHPFATMGTSNLVHERPLGQGYDDWKSSVASKQRAVSTLSLPEHGPLGLVYSARQMSCESASTFMTIADATTAPLRTNTDDNAYRLHRLLVCVWSRHAGPQLQEHTSVLLIGTPGRNARFTLVPIYPLNLLQILDATLVSAPSV